MISLGSRWMVDNGESIDVLVDRWFPRLVMFKIITPKLAHEDHSKVSDLIDFFTGGWKVSRVNEVLLPCDAEMVLSLPL